MNKLTQTKEEMLDALYTRAEEVALLCMKVNQEGLAQAHYSFSGHVNTLEVRMYGVGAKFDRDFESPDTIKYMYTKVYLLDFLGPEGVQEHWRNSMAEMEEMMDYLEELLEAGEKIEHPEQKPREQGAA